MSDFSSIYTLLYLFTENEDTLKVQEEQKFFKPEELKFFHDTLSQFKSIEIESIKEQILSKASDALKNLIKYAIEFIRTTLGDNSLYSDGNMSNVFCRNVEDIINDLQKEQKEKDKAIYDIYKNVNLLSAAREASKILGPTVQTNEFNKLVLEFIERYKTFLSVLGIDVKNLNDDDICNTLKNCNQKFEQYINQSDHQNKKENQSDQTNEKNDEDKGTENDEDKDKGSQDKGAENDEDKGKGEGSQDKGAENDDEDKDKGSQDKGAENDDEDKGEGSQDKGAENDDEDKGEGSQDKGTENDDEDKGEGSQDKGAENDDDDKDSQGKGTGSDDGNKSGTKKIRRKSNKSNKSNRSSNSHANKRKPNPKKKDKKTQ